MATALADLEDLVTCEVCFLMFEGRDPRSLSCLHAYCIHCLQSIYDTAVNKDPSKDDQIRCPTCQTVTPLKEKSPASLPKYFHASKVQDILGKLGKSSTLAACAPAQGSCLVCRSDEANWCCFTCAQIMCTTCNDNHYRQQSNRSHCALELVPSQLSTLQCSQHRALYTAYCTECFEPVCKSCQLLACHFDHVFKEFDVVSNRHYVLEAICGIEDATSRCSNGIAAVDCIKSDFDAHIDQVCLQVAQQKQLIVKQLDLEEEALVQALKTQQTSYHTEIDQVRKSLTGRKNQADTLRNQSAKLAQPIQDVPSITLRNLMDIVKERTKYIPKTDESVSVPATYEFTPVTHKAILGNVRRSREQDQDAFLSRYFGDNVCITPKTKEVTMSPLKLVWKNNIAANAKSLATFSGGDILVVCGNFVEAKLLMFNIEGKIQSVPLKIPEDYLPLNVAVCRVDDTIAILCMRQLSCEIILISKIFQEKHLSRPRWGVPSFCKLLGENFSIAFYSQDVLIVGGINNKTLTKYSRSGKPIMAKLVTHSCHSIAVCKSQVIVSDRHRVYVYGPDLDQVSFFSSDAQIPRSVTSLCVDLNSFVYTATTQGKVDKFTPDGAWLGTLTEQFHDLRCISVDKYILCGDKSCLAIYEMQNSTNP